MLSSIAEHTPSPRHTVIASTVHANMAEVRPALQELIFQIPLGFASLLIPTLILYLSIYARAVHRLFLANLLVFFSIGAFLACPYLAPLCCGPARSLQNITIACGCMKALDIFARRSSLPAYVKKPVPHPAVLAFIVLIEFRYESFAPNHIRTPRHAERFSEPTQLALMVAVFAALQSLPQTLPTILAFEVLLSIYITMTSGQLLIRYKSSPALFGPLYLADSLSGFWSETWHNCFASPCQGIAYEPIRNTLPRYGVPVVVARSLGVFAAFGLMAIFHIYAVAPILPWSSLVRIGLFFFLNGVGTVVEAMIWGKRKHWLKALLAWSFEIALATWTAKAAHIPNGLSHIPWKEVCGQTSQW